MKLITWTILLLTILTFVNLFGQDTISIYFDFGLSKIPENQMKVLNFIPTKYNLSELDSIYYIGVADSVGEFNSNLKLSEKRARNVAKYCEGLIPKNVFFKITPQGERTNIDKEKNRRVDMVLFFQKPQKEEIEYVKDFETIKACYNIDYSLLHRCHVRTVLKGKKELVIIETSMSNLEKEKKLYYGSTEQNGDFISKKIKWSSKRTGNLWWQETRFIATIPKKDFVTYKIFSIEEPPCDKCNERFQNYEEISKQDTCIQVDRFLVDNIQFKTTLFNNHSVKIRAPREYVNLGDRYFIGCGFDNPLKWETKEIKKKQNYYYSKLPRHFNYIANITRVMDCCKSNPEPSECDKPIVYCRNLGDSDKSLILNAEIGTNYQQTTITPYVGLGISKEGRFSRIGLFVGTDIDLSLCSSLSYQYHFLSFPFSVLNPIATWQSPTKQQIILKYGRLYIGTELNTRINKTKQNYLEQNIHIGLAIINTKTNAFIQRIFIQYGFGLDYLRNNSSGVYSITQLGINMKLARLKSNN